jgi:hypothetical protein
MMGVMRTIGLLVALGLGCATPVVLPVTWVDQQPPPPQDETAGTPRPGWVWQRGHWEMLSGQWQWRPGAWAAARDGETWKDGHWERREGKYHWVDGRWSGGATAGGAGTAG